METEALPINLGLYWIDRLSLIPPYSKQKVFRALEEMHFALSVIHTWLHSHVQCMMCTLMLVLKNIRKLKMVHLGKERAEAHLQNKEESLSVDGQGITQ